MNLNAPSRTSKMRRHLLLAAGLGLVGVVAWFAMKQRSTETPATETPAPSFEETYPGLDLADPVPSFEVLRYVMDTGGDDRTRQLAIVWLDNVALLEQPPSSDLEDWLMDMLTAHGHPEWDTEYRLWLFNSAFNVLHFGYGQEAFTRYLHQLALHDDVTTMRVYAIQHLGLQREDGRLSGMLAEQVRLSLHEMAKERDGGVAGMAIARLTEWNGSPDTAEAEDIAHALDLATDPTLPMNVRVTALNAAGPDALTLARKLAVDSTQPVILRKSAIACIGIHGGPEDIADLEQLRVENFRLAQASNPAIRKLRDRLTTPNPPVLLPF